MRLLEYIKHVKPSYEPDWFHLAIIAELEKVAAGEQSLLVSCGPGHGKTELISILFPSWLVEEDPGTHIISLSNSDGLARLAAGNILRIVQSPQFQELCPTELDKASEQQFQVKGNDGRPTLHSAGINGQLTGHRAKFLLADDLIKSLADAYSETVRERVWSNFNSAAETRLLPDGQIVMIHTRWSLQDPIQQALDRAKNPLSRQFIYLNFAAVNNGQDSFRLETRTGEKQFFPPYKSLATKKGQPYSFGPRQLKGKEADLGPVVYSALYQGNPVSREGQMFPARMLGSSYREFEHRRFHDDRDGLGHGFEGQGQQRSFRELRGRASCERRLRGARLPGVQAHVRQAAPGSDGEGPSAGRAVQDDPAARRRRQEFRATVDRHNKVAVPERTFGRGEGRALARSCAPRA